MHHQIRYLFVVLAGSRISHTWEGKLDFIYCESRWTAHRRRYCLSRLPEFLDLYWNVIRGNCFEIRIPIPGKLDFVLKENSIFKVVMSYNFLGVCPVWNDRCPRSICDYAINFQQFKGMDVCLLTFEKNIKVFVSQFFRKQWIQKTLWLTRFIIFIHNINSTLNIALVSMRDFTKKKHVCNICLKLTTTSMKLHEK